MPRNVRLRGPPGRTLTLCEGRCCVRPREDVIKIGEFAARTGISIATLRHHHRRGYLVPSSVDPLSAYRTYAPQQVAQARLLADLAATGMPLPDAAAAAARGNTAAVRDHLAALEHRAAGLRGWLDGRDGPDLPTASVRLRPRELLITRRQVPVHGVVDALRAVRAEAARHAGRTSGRLPTAAAWDRGAQGAAPDGPVIRLLAASYLDLVIDVEVGLPWRPGLPCPPSFVRATAPTVPAVVVDVGELVRLDLADVHRAHRRLDERGAVAAARLQVYDARISRLWVVGLGALPPSRRPGRDQARRTR